MTRWTQCRYLRKSGEQCTAEAVDDAPDAELIICAKHLGAAVRLIRERQTHTRRTA